MKDLESPEQRAMEREMLRAARERKQRGLSDGSHIVIALGLFIVAGICSSLGYAGVAIFVLIGAVAEIGAWAMLLDGNRRMPKVETPPVTAALERRQGDKGDAV